MEFETLIINGDVVTESGIQQVNVGINGGRIAALLPRSEAAPARETIDAAGSLVIPGAVDIHFHCRAPAYPQRGDFATETRAAAAGGVTTIFEMPISKPCCATGDIFRSRKALGEADSYVNFALYGAPGLLDRNEIADMANEGAIGFKIFMTGAPAGRNDEFEGLCLPNVPELYQAMQLVAETGLVCVVHAENDQLLEWHTAKLLADKRNDVAAHGESRPPHVEALAVATLLTLNQTAGMQLHIAHMTSKETLDVFRMYKQAGAKATAETCPQYLFFTEADMERVGPYAKINPPLRKQADVDALWGGIDDGTLMAVTTDHSPFTVEEKERARTDIWRTPPGAPGVEELVLGMLDAALKGRLSIEKAVQLISTNGAKRFGIYPQKGAIAVGADADIVIYDTQATTTISPDMLFSQAKDCDKLYEGMTFQGQVKRTMVNGTTVFVDGEVIGKRGGGKFVRPDAANVQML
ncbi:MAG: amidohydrolase family protein [Chloroflexi bacterium]|nr:amidohydrolase family protein [Chloroflexota bacterium]MCC6895306.1 amidohydrolase family protein [Anaerolineae bacterium]